MHETCNGIAEVKENIGHTPSRMDLFLQMDDEIINLMKRNSKYNLFKDYITFLDNNNEIKEEYINTIAHEFLKTLENTSMTKSYKMPILKAFYNKGNIKMNITEDDVYNAMKEFYSYKSNGVDMLKDKKTKNYKTWTKENYINLAKTNPIKYLKKTHSKFFIEKEGYILSLNEELEHYITSDTFKAHFEDIINYRTINYYKTRNLNSSPVNN